MFFLNQNPFVRIIIPFIAGIFLGQRFDFIPGFAIICFSLLAVSSLFVFFSNRFETYSTRWISGLLFTSFFLTFGMFYSGYRFNENISQREIPTGENLTLVVRISDDVEIRANSVKTIVKCESIITDTALIACGGKMLCYFHKDTLSEKLRYGDRLIVNASLQYPQSAMNPYAFNYRKYLAQQGIYHTTWIGKEKMKILERDKGNPFIAFSLKLRNRILDILKTQLGDNDEYKVAAAIIAGYRTALDADLRATFANSGAMHVMCVSGLHVGIIYLILGFLLKFLSDKIVWQRIIKVIIILAFIWLYALLTGFSASVLRASTMFSFVAGGMLFQRKVPIYNSLAASALLLLLFNPVFIFQPGFQLSYLAVIGIVSLFPLIRKLIPAKGKIATKLSDLVAVSVAAQIATSPISLYYFNQFPNYFILTNIIVVPLAGLIIYTAIPALLLNAVPLAGELLSKLLALEMKIMNGSVNFIDKLPGSVSQHVFISFLQMILLYAMIILLYHGILNRSKVFIRTSALLILVFAGIGSFHQIRQMQHKEMLIPYGLDDAIIVVDQGKCTVITDDTTHTFQKKFASSFGKYLTYHKIGEPVFISRSHSLATGSFIYHYPVIQYRNQRFLIFDNTWKQNQSEHFFQTDYILLEQSPFVEFDKLSADFQNDIFIFTSNNKKNTVRIWERLAENKNIPYYNIFSSGAFIVRSGNQE
jgi:competence protein ComEC